MARGAATKGRFPLVDQQLKELLGSKKITLFTKTEQAIILLFGIKFIKSRDYSDVSSAGQIELAKKVLRHEESVKNALQSLEAQNIVQTMKKGRRKESRLLLSGAFSKIMQILSYSLCNSLCSVTERLLQEKAEKKKEGGRYRPSHKKDLEELVKEKRKELQIKLAEAQLRKKVMQAFQEQETAIIEEWTEELFALILSRTADLRRPFTGTDRKAIKEFLQNKREEFYHSLE